jgi:hypothetical protein
MSSFREHDRATPYLLPPSIDEWLPERHLARFVVEIISGDRTQSAEMSPVLTHPEMTWRRPHCLAGHIGFEVRRETGKE